MLGHHVLRRVSVVQRSEPNKIHYNSFFWFIQMSLQWGFEWYGNKRSSGLTSMPWQSESFLIDAHSTHTRCSSIPTSSTKLRCNDNCFKRVTIVFLIHKDVLLILAALLQRFFDLLRCLFDLRGDRSRLRKRLWRSNKQSTTCYVGCLMLVVLCICWDRTPLHS